MLFLELGRRLRGLATHDFFPDFSGRMRRALVTPLGGLLAAVLVAALCGLFMHPRVFAFAGGLLAAVVVGIGWPGMITRGVTARVGFDRDRCTEGDAIGATTAVVNHLPWPVAGLSLRGGDDLAARLAPLAGRSESVHRWNFVPPRRGVYPLAPPCLTTGFPFGIWEAKRLAKVQGSLIVWPRTFPVGPPPPSESDATIEGNVVRQKVGATGEMLGVRPYRRGDSPRRIHWAQSAKHDRLIVCELESTSRPAVQLVLDIDASGHTSGPHGTLEWAVRVTASLARGWLEAGAQVGLVTSAESVPAASGAGQINRLLDALARVPRNSLIPLRDVLDSSACRRFRSGVQIAIATDRVPATRGERRRWVVLKSAGFGGESPHSATCEEGPPRPAPKAWLDIDRPERVAHLLRFGWSEARHGS